VHSSRLRHASLFELRQSVVLEPLAEVGRYGSFLVFGLFAFSVRLSLANIEAWLDDFLLL
jgi:hypothetical protein